MEELIERVEDDYNEDRIELQEYFTTTQAKTGHSKVLTKRGSVINLLSSEGDCSAYWYFFSVDTNDIYFLTKEKRDDEDEDEDDEEEE